LRFVKRWDFNVTPAFVSNTAHKFCVQLGHFSTNENICDIMLKASDLIKSHSAKKDRMKEVYKHLCEMCCDKLRRHNDRGLTAMLYKLSPISSGMPVYDTNAALKYIEKKLTRGGFSVTRVDTLSILIDWSRAK